MTLKDRNTGQVVEGVDVETFLRDVSNPMDWDEIVDGIPLTARAASKEESNAGSAETASTTPDAESVPGDSAPEAEAEAQ